MGMTDEQSSLIKDERARLSVTLVLFAISRDIDAMATGDQRFIAAADSVKKIEATLHMVDDAVLLKLASVRDQQRRAVGVDRGAVVRNRLRVTALRGCTVVHRAHRGDGGPDTARRAPVPALTVQPPSGFIEPCLPSKVARPPSGPLWVHEIKHDGYRLMVRRDGLRVRCFTRNGQNWADRFKASLRLRSASRQRRS
jgi:ATP-dependent DNA ligase